MNRPTPSRHGRHARQAAPSPLRPAAWAALAALGAFAAAGPAAHAQPAPPVAQRVEIIGTTQLPGAGLPRDQMPSNVQTADDRRLRQAQSLNLPDFMSTALPSVNVNEIQGNPYQMDVNYRGFSASPLLGTPQGLSVFQDGVRVNEPFGDVVNWDIIPTAALADMTLLPGSNPLFGLNTLGGALSLQTKSGDTHPGTQIELQGGSFGRVNASVSHGLSWGGSGHVFLAASGLNEDGWREHSPSRVRQRFGKVGQHARGYTWDLAVTHADNRLIGNGLLPEAMLAERRAQVYTRPDLTENKMTLVSLNTMLRLNAEQQLSATLYSRRADARTLNGDLNDSYDPPAVPESGVENRTRTSQRGSGLALQWSRTTPSNRLAVGATLDRSRSRFTQTAAAGQLDNTRAVVPTDDAAVDAWISGHSRTASVFATDTVSLRSNLQLTLSGRYNNTRVDTVDLGRAELGLPTALDGEGRYRKFNPAAGLTWQLTPTYTAYAGYSQGNRAPSPIELGCSDPDNACVLPNAMQSDPPLKQVVSRTLEAGVRGTLVGSLRWNVSVFRTVNRDDLLFISNRLAAGYFTNFGRTRRQGVELSLAQRRGSLNWAVAYSYLQASFGSSACLVSGANSSAETSAACTGENEIEVRPGNHLPGLPAHNLKLAADWQATPAWNVGAQLTAHSSQYVRGNENNAHQPDGVDFNGAGRVGGHALLNLTTQWKPGESVELFAKVSNVLDRNYATAGALGENAFGPGGVLRAPADWRDEQFVGAGAPRGLWLGVRLQF